MLLRIMHMCLVIVVTIVVLYIMEYRDIKFADQLVIEDIDISRMVTSFSTITLTFNGLLLGFSPISVFNFINWSDNKIRSDPSDIETRIVRSAFSRFTKTYFETNILVVFGQVVCAFTKYISIKIGLLLLFFDILFVLIILDGFWILLRIVLSRVEAEDEIAIEQTHQRPDE